MKQEMSGVLFKTAQEQMVAHMIVQVILLTPTFKSAIVIVISFFVIESTLVFVMLSPGDEDYARNLFSPIVWGLGGFVCAHVMFHRDIRRQMAERKSTLKW